MERVAEPPADRVVLVAGAAGTLGQVVARQFASGGARIALVGSRRERLDEVRASLAVGPHRAIVAAADLRSRDAAFGAVAAVVDAFGRVDILVQAVGGWLPGAPIASLDPADLASLLDQHVWTTLHLLQAVVPRMVEAGWGRVVAVSAPAAVDAPAKAAAYAAAKAGQEALIRSAAHELEGTGVTANIVVVRSIEASDPTATAQRPPAGKRTSTTPEEIAAAIRYLCSDDAARINGARLPLFGG